LSIPTTIVDKQSKEKKAMKRIFLMTFLFAVTAQLGFSQEMPETSPGWFNRYGRWSFDIQGGGNIWLNDYNTDDISGGINAILRYGLSRHFSLGFMGGYDALQSKNTKYYNATDTYLKHGYIEAKGYSGDLTAWYHFAPGKPVSPYVYAGVGGFFYKRKIEGGVYYTENKSYTSIHVPLGIGLEMAASKYVAFSIEAGARILDNYTDNWATGSMNWLGTDWYPTARAGVSFYFGSSPDDDNDGDGLTNGYEEKIGTDPNKTDTDGDGLSDYEEVTKYHTNPVKADSDGDGLSDSDEVVKYHTDPLKVDTDGDGMSDGAEVSQYHTDPVKVDTDVDGLSDGDEVTKYKTDPTKSDTDGDGLSDYDEAMKYKTDPLKMDTDGGSVNDGKEIANGTNPIEPGDDMPKPKLEVGKAMVLEGIVFKSGKSTIDPSSEPTLMQALEAFEKFPTATVEIRGYTDNVGKASANKKLSLARAEAVKSWLVMKGADATRITTKGFGPENPIGDNKTPDGRAKNRRIEFYRTK
jgi:outer membrane protein OmpA-like peptidoglycan-associated protein